MSMDHSDARYPTPQWAEQMRNAMDTKFENLAQLLRLATSQQEEMAKGYADITRRLEKIEAVMLQEFGGAW